MMILKSGLEVTQGHWDWYDSKIWVWCPINTMALSCIVCEI